MSQCIAKISSGRQCLREAAPNFKTCNIKSHREQEKNGVPEPREVPIVIVEETPVVSKTGSGEITYHSIYSNYEIMLGDKGQRVQFMGGTFKTSDKTIIKELDSLSIFGTKKLMRL